MAYFDYEQAIFRYLDNLKHQLNFRPLTLGGTSGENGGQSGPPGGFIGVLPQTKVAYDTVEAAVLQTASGVSNMTRTMYPVWDFWQKKFVLLPTYDPNAVREYATIPANDTTSYTNILVANGDRTAGEVLAIDAGTWKFTTQWTLQSTRPGNSYVPTGWTCDIYAYVERFVPGSGYLNMFNIRTNHIVGDNTYYNEFQSSTVESVQGELPFNASTLQITYKAHVTTSDTYNMYITPIGVEQIVTSGVGVQGRIFGVTMPSSIMEGWTPDMAPPGITAVGNITGTWTKGSSLVDNLNHIRGRIQQLETSMNQLVYTFEGTAEVGASPIKFYNFIKDRKIVGVYASCTTAPTGTSIKVDIHKNGTTIFTDQSHRPEILAGEYYGESRIIDNSDWGLDDYLTANIDQVGSTIPGQYPVVYVVYR